MPVHRSPVLIWLRWLNRRPPVYTLWKHPTLLPVLTTPAPVILVLVGGADLMVSGGAREIA